MNSELDPSSSLIQNHKKFNQHGNVRVYTGVGRQEKNHINLIPENESLDESGYLDDEKVLIKDSVYLYPEDIRMLQLAKSAICAGILTLIETAEINVSSISTLYVAGGFGNYLNIKNATAIGLIPKKLSEKAKVIGNGALSGASLLLLNKELRKKAKDIAQNATVVELAANPIFSEKYMMSMILEGV